MEAAQVEYNPSNVRFPAGTLIDLGVRKFVGPNERDDKVSKADFEAALGTDTYPDMFVRAYLNVGGLTHAEGVQRGGGDVPVTYQKLTRDLSSQKQVDLWRAQNEKVYGRDENGYLVVVLDPYATATKGGLGIPMQDIDKLEYLQENVTLVYEAMLAERVESDMQEHGEVSERTLKLARQLYDQMETMKANGK